MFSAVFFLKIFSVIFTLKSVSAENNNELFPTLPIVVDDSENIYCENDSELLKINLENNILWAYQSKYQ